MTLKFAKFSDFKHSNRRPTVRIRNPLSGLSSCYPPPKSSCKGGAHPYFYQEKKTKAWAEYLSQSQ